MGIFSVIFTSSAIIGAVYFACRISNMFAEQLDIQRKTDGRLFDRFDYLANDIGEIHDTVVTMRGVPVWIARDKDGELWAYDGKPVRQAEEWACKRSEDEAYRLPKTLSNVTWEDEPVKTWISVREDRA